MAFALNFDTSRTAKRDEMKVELKVYAQELGAPFEEIPSFSDISALPISSRLEKYFQHGPFSIAHLPQVIFSPETGLVSTPDGRIVSQCTLPVHEARALQRNDKPHLRASLAYESLPSGPTAIIGGSRNFYHWFLNVCSKVMALEKSQIGKEVETLLFSCAQSQFHKETIRSRPYLSERSTHIATHPEPILLNDVIVSTMHGNPIQSLDQLAWIRETPCFAPSPVGRRVYIDRKDSPSGVRQLHNSDEVRELLKEFDFESVVLSELSLAEQAAVFREADCVVALHGAGLTNLIHCARRPHIFELSSEASFSNVFHALGKATGVRRYDIIVGDDIPGRAKNKRDIRIDIAKIEDKLALLE